MSGLCGVVARQNCSETLLYGTDYHSHLGSQLAGMAVVFLGLGAAVQLHAPVVVFTLLTAASALAGRAFEPPSGAMVWRCARRPSR